MSSLAEVGKIIYDRLKEIVILKFFVPPLQIHNHVKSILASASYSYDLSYEKQSVCHFFFKTIITYVFFIYEDISSLVSLLHPLVGGR